MDFNNIDERVKLLYSALNCHFVSFKKDIHREIVYGINDQNGKRTFTITLGTKPLTEKDQLEATNRFLHLIISIANLKDHFKNYIKAQNINLNIEDFINNSFHNSLIIDLANQEKHGYPLTKSNRSKKNPLIKNIKEVFETKLPLNNIMNDVNELKIIIDADIIDGDNVFLMSLSNLIYKSLDDWEDFIVDQIRYFNTDFISRVMKRRLLKNKTDYTQNLIDKYQEIISRTVWYVIPNDKLDRYKVL